MLLQAFSAMLLGKRRVKGENQTTQPYWLIRSQKQQHNQTQRHRTNPVHQRKKERHQRQA